MFEVIKKEDSSLEDEYYPDMVVLNQYRRMKKKAKIRESNGYLEF